MYHPSNPFLNSCMHYVHAQTTPILNFGFVLNVVCLLYARLLNVRKFKGVLYLFYRFIRVVYNKFI